MPTMNDLDARRINLTLLPALEALLETRSVTAAARRTSVSQSAMSHSLARLREVLGDPLLTPAGRNLVLSPRAARLAASLPGALDQLTTWVTQVVVRLDNLVPGDLTGFDASQIDLKGPLVSAGSQVGATLARFAPQAIASTANVGIAVTVWLLFVFVLFVEGKRLFEFVMVISPLASAHELAIAQEVREMIVANFVAIAATAALNGVLLGGIFWASPLEPAGLWAVVAFGMSFVPALGAAAVWITGALYLLATGHSGWALGITIFGLVVIAQTDNVVKPLLMRGRVNIHPLLLMLSLLGGATAMGPAGLVFGPVFVAVLQAALRIYKREFATPI